MSIAEHIEQTFYSVKVLHIINDCNREAVYGYIKTSNSN